MRYKNRWMCPMWHRVVGTLVMLLVLLYLCTGSAEAQLATSKLYAVFPPGSQRGTTVEVHVTAGEHLYEPTSIWFSHAGIRGRLKTLTVEGEIKPLFGTFEVSVANDVPPGAYDVRVGSSFGLSNPRTFVVDGFIEVQEQEPNDTPEAAQAIPLNRVLHGVAAGNADEDYFQLQLRSGQRLLVLCEARTLDSRMNPELTLCRADGQLCANGHLNGRGDLLLDYAATTEETVTLRVADQVFRSGSDCFYRLTIHDGPQVDFVFPPAAAPGISQPLTIFGRNLPAEHRTAAVQTLATELRLPTHAKAEVHLFNRAAHSALCAGTVVTLPLDSARPATRCNQAWLATTTQPVIVEHEPNNTASEAQTIAVPGEFAGQFAAVGDADVFTFDALAKEVWLLELFSQRVGSAADPYLVVERISATGAAELIAELDDQPSPVAAEICNFATDDPAYRLVVPQAGRYRLTLRDRFGSSRGGPDLLYRLSIRREVPDFQLFALPLSQEDRLEQCIRPQAIAIRPGEQFAVAVLAVRRGGFNEAIEISSAGLPPGVTTAGALLDPRTAVTYLVFTAEPTALPWHGTIELSGRSSSGLSQPVQEMTTVWDGTREQRLSRGICLSVMQDTAPVSLEVSNTALRVAQGSQLMLPLEYHHHLPAVSQERLELFPRLEKNGLSLENPQVLRGDYPNPGTKSVSGKLLVDRQGEPGTYRVHLKSFSKHNYRPGESAVARAKAEQAAAKKLLAKAASDLAAAQAHARGEAVEQAQARKAKIAGWLAATEAHLTHTQQMVASSKFGGRNYHISPVLTLSVVPAPFELLALPPSRLKPGTTVEIPLTLKRAETFEGAVTVELLVAADIPIVTAQPVEIAADADQALLRVTAEKDFTWSPTAWFGLRGTTQGESPICFEMPLKLDVAAPRRP